MGDVHSRNAKGSLQPDQLDAQVFAQPGVQIGQRFVEQQNRRFHHQRARERQSLLLPA